MYTKYVLKQQNNYKECEKNNYYIYISSVSSFLIFLLLHNLWKIAFY